jgi:hypothetical protein
VIDPASRNEVISNKGIGLQNNKEWYGPKWYAPLYWYVGVVMHGVSRNAVTGENVTNMLQNTNIFFYKRDIKRLILSTVVS